MFKKKLIQVTILDFCSQSLMSIPGRSYSRNGSQNGQRVFGRLIKYRSRAAWWIRITYSVLRITYSVRQTSPGLGQKLSDTKISVSGPTARKTQSFLRSKLDKLLVSAM